MPHRGAWALLVACLLLASPPPAVAAAKDVRVVTLHYVTDRNLTKHADARRLYGDRLGALHFGTCRVATVAHGKPGVFSRLARWCRVPGRVLPGVRVRDVQPLEHDAFVAALRDSIRGSASCQVLVFVHGYNVSFDNAARFTAQMARDLGFAGPVVLYSWPATSSYLADEETVVCTQEHLETVLRELAAGPEGAGLHLLSYSLGARAVAGALDHLSARRDSLVRIEQVILAAPDLDRRRFEQLAPRLCAVARRVTLYASSRDHTMRTSRNVHRHPRAGEVGRDLLVLPGLDTVDVSRIRADFTGHGYLDEVLGDIRRLLATGGAPGDRPGLSAAAQGDLTFWRLQQPPR